MNPNRKRGQHKPGSRGFRRFRYPEDIPSYKERRLDILRRLAESPHGWRWNGSRRAKRSQHARDVMRMIEDGLLRITPRNGTAKMLVMTDAGRKLIARPVAPHRDPWAKRRHGIAEFKMVNA